MKIIYGLQKLFWRSIVIILLFLCCIAFLTASTTEYYVDKIEMAQARRKWWRIEGSRRIRRKE